MYRSHHSRIVPWLVTALTVSGVSSAAAQSAAQTATPPAAQAAVPTTSDSVDRAVVFALSKANRDEIALSRAAQPSLQDAEVKRFAQRMIDDHGAGLTAITTIGTRLGYPLPTDPAAAGATGTTDAQYINALVLGHQQLLGQLPIDPAKIKDAGLRQHVTDARKTVQMHLDDAKRIQARVGPGRTP